MGRQRTAKDGIPSGDQIEGVGAQEGVEGLAEGSEGEIEGEEEDGAVRELAESEIAGLHGTLRSKLEEWTEKQAAEDEIPAVWLYKYDHPRNGKTRALVWQGEEIPDENTIGIMYGPGRYILLAQLPRNSRTGAGKRITGYVFRCHDSYEAAHKQYLTEQAKAQQGEHNGHDNNGGGQGFMQGIALVKEVISAIGPLLNSQKSPSNGGADMAGAGALMLKTYDTVGNMLAQSQIQTHKMLADTLKQTRETMTPEDDYDEDEEEPQGDAFLRGITEFAAKYLPQVLGNGPVADAAAAFVKASPDFKRIKKSPADMGKLIAYLDNLHGQEKVDKALTKIGINGNKYRG